MEFISFKSLLFKSELINCNRLHTWGGDMGVIGVIGVMGVLGWGKCACRGLGTGLKGLAANGNCMGLLGLGIMGLTLILVGCWDLGLWLPGPSSRLLGWWLVSATYYWQNTSITVCYKISFLFHQFFIIKNKASCQYNIVKTNKHYVMNRWSIQQCSNKKVSKSLFKTSFYITDHLKTKLKQSNF